jgi:hypothetical protein
MVYNQLFKIMPDRTILMSVIKLFGISDLDNNIHFTINDLDNLKTSDELKKMTSTLREYYIPCKSKLYLNEINNKRAITILKQLLKIYNYSIINKYKTINGNRIKYYIIHKTSENIIVPKKKILISFD